MRISKATFLGAITSLVCALGLRAGTMGQVSVDAPVFDILANQRKLDFICCNGGTNITSLDVTFDMNITAADFDNSADKAGCTVNFAAAKVIVECLGGIAAGTKITTLTQPDTAKFTSACWDPAGACIAPATAVPEPSDALLGSTGLFLLLAWFRLRRRQAESLRGCPANVNEANRPLAEGTA